MNNSAPPLLRLNDVSKTYRSKNASVVALDRVCISISKCEMVALKGPSGSGKSTLLNLCGLLDKADSGSCMINDTDITTLSDSQLTVFRRKNIGFIFQNFNLIPAMTVFENVEYPLLLNGVSSRNRKRAVNHLLRQFEIDSLRNSRPDHISGGQQQRVAIARSMVKSPEFVIADEPTANLDSSTTNTIIDFMRKIICDSGVTVLIATHDDNVAQRCDRVITVKDGVVK